MIRRFTWQNALIAVGAIFVLWMIVGVLLAGRNEPAPPSGTVPVTLHGGRVTGNRIGRAESWTFNYKSAQMSPDGTQATVDGVRHGNLYKKGEAVFGYLGGARIGEHANVRLHRYGRRSHRIARFTARR